MTARTRSDERRGRFRFQPAHREPAIHGAQVSVRALAECAGDGSRSSDGTAH